MAKKGLQKFRQIGKEILIFLEKQEVVWKSETGGKCIIDFGGMDAPAFILS